MYFQRYTKDMYHEMFFAKEFCALAAYLLCVLCVNVLFLSDFSAEYWKFL